jgi:DNA-binding phage protein
MAKSEKEKGLIVQLRKAILESDRTLYRVAKDSQVGMASLYRFMQGKSGLSIDSIDRIFETLELQIVSKKSRKTKGPAK